LLSLSGKRRKTEHKNDREPDPLHAHLGGGWLAASLADDGGSQELAAGDSYIALILTDQESSEVSRGGGGFPAIVATSAARSDDQ